MLCFQPLTCFFFFNDTATTEIYTLSLHDALPIYSRNDLGRPGLRGRHEELVSPHRQQSPGDGEEWRGLPLLRSKDWVGFPLRRRPARASTSTTGASHPSTPASWP